MNKICVVTGGSSGIGLAIVKAFIDAGYQVYNLDISHSEIGHFIHCDMASQSEVASAMAKIITDNRKIDVLISNAGIHQSANIENTSEQMLDNVFAINVKGAFAATQAVLPIMKQQQHGAIIYIASDQAIIGKQNSFAYNLSKHALASMAKTTALDYAQFNIRANAICPGTIETPLYHQAIDNYCQRSGAIKAEVHQAEQALQPLNRLGQPEEVAQYALFLASDKATFITGSLPVIDGGYTVG
ncbi:SDR family NAD(P)-dependent oxidoreductase [Thalassotalea sp. ND16A]|uniref:SDR family NAD(P)-dependent oxidoreductase n=1 Tax=Thalassotalea sp. ND16A TaxID=1535422 RepID=UPI000519EF65|nr:SDR family oxidoreductase [Thalassotalea sp. ND16A]KGJ89218.1 3-oxoacyl-(acyl-carrier-protein) reductase [Thalassotalea sp. ND16A]